MSQPHLLLHRTAQIAVVLVVHARDLLIALGDDADLLDRRPIAIDHQAFDADAGCGELIGQPVGGHVPSHHADERHPGAKGGEIVGDIGGAAETHELRLKMHDRHRRFRRDARHVADDEAVEHDVADDQDVVAAQARDDVPRAARGERRDGHAWRVGSQPGGRRRTAA